MQDGAVDESVLHGHSPSKRLIDRCKFIDFRQASLALGLCVIATGASAQVSIDPLAKSKASGVTSGIASYYGPGFHGRRTANGETFNARGFSAAHRYLPLPSYVRVTNTANGRSIVVRVNDRGPFHGNRMIDVSQRTAEVLDFKSRGIGKVKVEYLGRAARGGSDDNRLLATYQDPARPISSGGMAVAALAAPAPVAIAYAPTQSPIPMPIPAPQIRPSIATAEAKPPVRRVIQVNEPVLASLTPNLRPSVDAAGRSVANLLSGNRPEPIRVDVRIAAAFEAFPSMAASTPPVGERVASAFAALVR